MNTSQPQTPSDMSVEEIVGELNDLLEFQLEGSKSELRRPFVYLSCGTTQAVEFLGQPVWDSENSDWTLSPEHIAAEIGRAAQVIIDAVHRLNIPGRPNVIPLKSALPFLRDGFLPFRMVDDDHVLVTGRKIIWLGANGEFVHAHITVCRSPESVIQIVNDDTQGLSGIYIESIKFYHPTL